MSMLVHLVVAFKVGIFRTVEEYKGCKALHRFTCICETMVANKHKRSGKYRFSTIPIYTYIFLYRIATLCVVSNGKIQEIALIVYNSTSITYNAVLTHFIM